MFISIHIGWNLWVDVMDGALCHAGQEEFGTVASRVIAGPWDEWSDEWSEFLIHSIQYINEHAPRAPC